MKQLDIMGNEVDYFELNKPKETSRQTIKDKFRRINGYLQGKICKECKYLKTFKQHYKTYYKCEKIGVTNSEATDIRLKDCACRLFKEIETTKEIIKPNDYVRTYQGDIGKVATVTSTGIIIEDERHIHFDRITKHSPNIIDVIEVDDYVNGYKVSFIDKDYKPFVQCDYPVQAGTTNHYRFYEEAIYSIVTHESFNSIKYEVI